MKFICETFRVIIYINENSYVILSHGNLFFIKKNTNFFNIRRNNLANASLSFAEKRLCNIISKNEY